jgi:hypothetical protein
MTTDLDSLIANLSTPDRDRLKGAFAADPELATGLETMLADLPASTQETLVRSSPFASSKPRWAAARSSRLSPTSSRPRSSAPRATTHKHSPYCSPRQPPRREIVGGAG